MTVDGEAARDDGSGWEAVVDAARVRARSRQARMVERHGLSGDVRYDWSLDDARITWARGGTVFLTGRLTLLGTVALDRETWLWSWANPSLPPAVLGDVDQIRRYGEEHGHPVLPWPGFDAHPGHVAAARLVAASVLDAEGLWADTADGVQLPFLLHDLTPTGA
ncbi:DUF6882 domain-containing protein [Streptomyces sp. NPDC058417]|uniref:DUF6882 domain-containing protein n=1 Tax=unclassified Streptomyces TaxID=2593676 RepID=UPI00365327D6